MIVQPWLARCLRYPRKGVWAAVPAVLLAAGLLIACGEDATPTSGATPTAEPASSSPAATTSTPAAPAAEILRLQPLRGVELGAPPVPAPSPGGDSATTSASVLAPYEAFGTDAAPGVFPRTVRHAMGETVIETRPQRVVVLDSDALNAVAELGVRPAGYAETAAQTLPDYLADAVADSAKVGLIAEPDLEQIAALRPDLILSNKGRHPDIYDELAAIAPTVYGDSGGIAWRQNFELYAQALGVEEAGAATVLAYEERVRHLNELLPTERPAVSLIRVRRDALRYYLRVNFAAQVLEDLGFPRPALQNVEDVLVDEVSLERLRDYNADAGLLIVAFDGGVDSERSRALREDPLWQSLPAVQEGQVLAGDTALWFAGVGYGGAHAVLDELIAFLGIDE
jgi:iron complex transport system substrate-binding protein